MTEQRIDLTDEQRDAIARLLTIAEMYTQPWSPATRKMLDRYKVIFPAEFLRRRTPLYPPRTDT